MRTELVIADYQDEKHQHDLVELLNAYAVDPMGGGKEAHR